MEQNLKNLLDDDNPWGILARDIANQAWLIGLGVVSKAQEEGGKMLESLMNEGKALEARLAQGVEKGLSTTEKTGAAEATQPQVAETSEDVEKIFEARVIRALERLEIPSSDDLQSVSKELDALRRTIEMLRKDQRG